jgi:serine/threonine protein phosphatase PrpC
MHWQTKSASASYRVNSEDRTAIVESPFGLVLLIADGVGGRSGGGAAADFFVQRAATWVGSLTQAPSAHDLHAFLSHVDFEMSRAADIGETTALMVLASADGIQGAATGDSAAWWITDSRYVDLSRDAGQKPWLGSGLARIQPFAHRIERGTLLLATDGLSKYADTARLCAIARGGCLDQLPRELIEAVRLPSGTLQDDVAVILARFNGSGSF